MTDEELIRKLEAASLGRDEFHHADHVQAAFFYLGRYPALEAVERFSGALRRQAAAHGKAERYHQTITWALMFLIHERIARSSQAQTWAQFTAANPDLLDWKQNVLRRYYEDDTLKSDLARSVFLLPDRVPGKA